MAKILIKSTGRTHRFYSRADVPARVLKLRFHWLTEEDWEGYLKFQGFWYHVSEFKRTSCPDFKDWSGVMHESLTTGVLIRVPPDFNYDLGYVAGTYRIVEGQPA